MTSNGPIITKKDHVDRKNPEFHIFPNVSISKELYDKIRLDASVLNIIQASGVNIVPPK